MADTRNGGGTAKADSAKRKTDKRNRNVKAAAIGGAIGIGSAALVAALMYANRPREEEDQVAPDPRFEPRES